MPSKKEIILQLLKEGKSSEDLFLMGYNKKYVKEIIRNEKKQNNETSLYETKSKYTKCDNITHIQRDIREIKDLLISKQWENKENCYCVKSKSNEEKLSDLLKVLELIKNNEQLLKKLNIEIKISLGDLEENKGKDTCFDNDIIDKINPIEICREKGEKELKNILQDYDITTLKEIAKQYTPDSRGYVYKWTDIEKVISYIVERSNSLSKKGSVFVSD